MRPASSVDLPSGVSDLGSGMVSVGVSTLTNFEIVLCLPIMHFSALQGRGAVEHEEKHCLPGLGLLLLKTFFLSSVRNILV